MQLSVPHRSKGFALLITVTLLAFLVLLLVSLATLTRVETQVANNNQQRSQARQNALMALNIAIGQLQKYAGPDQRTTARSDMDATLATTSTQSGRWTGAYGNGVPVGGFGNPDKYDESPTTIQTNLSTYYTDPANASDPYALKGSQARLLNWLVSGNESATFVAATSGQITTKGAGITFTPTDAVVLGGGTALATDIKVKNLPARLLVGPNSAKDPSDYVAAPLVPISAVTPGLGAAPVPIGNYAWWAGDEGAKARLNLPMATSTQAPLAFVSSQRAAIELVDGKNPVGSTTSTDLIGAAYPSDATNTTDQANLIKVMNAAQLPILTPASASDLTKAIKYRYHDLTGYSSSVLSDTYAGGLKKDLSAVLAPLSATGATSPLDTDVIFTPEPNSGSATNEFGLPTWGMLRNHAQTTAPASGALVPQMPIIKLPTKNGVLIGTSPTATSAGLYPVMTYSAVGFQYGVPQTATMPADTVGNPIHLAIFPVVVLWNPYTTDIQAAQYEFGIKKTYAGLLEFQRRNAGDTNAWSAANKIDGVRDFGNAGKASTGASSYFRFVIDSGVIPAGKSLVFTLQTNGTTYDTTSNANMLANALKSTSYNPGGHVLMPSTLTVVAPGATYRVGVNGNSGTYYGTPVTFFTNTSCNFGGNVAGGPGSFDSYLSPFPASTPPTTSLLPYTGSSSTGFTSQVYQQFSPGTSAPFNAVSPYAFPSAPSGSGYAVATVSTGLLQNEGQISMITLPTFRMLNQGVFSAKGPTSNSIRWIPTTNPRAYILAGFPSGGNSSAPFFSGQPPASVGIWPQGLSVKASPPDGGGPRVSSGTSLTDITSGPTTTGGIVDTTLFEFRPENQPLMAIGQLQHANLAWANGYPSYLIGNSAGWAGNGDVVRLTGGTWSTPAKLITANYDLSWLLNRSLWDKYFVSTVPHAGSGKTGDTETTPIPDALPNPRHLFYAAAPSDSNIRTKLNADQAAAHLLLSGGFNINSTSEQAWRAVLGGMNNLSFDPTGNGNGGSASPDSVISRFSKPLTNASYSGSAVYNAWQGYKKLTKDQIALLAKNIVTEIRARGPFVSLGDFINHRLFDNGTFPVLNDKRLKGALQAAIDASSGTAAGSSAINTGSAAPFISLVNDAYNAVTTNAMKTSSLTTNSSGAVVANVTAPYSSTAAYAPQFLTQADVLSAVGSGLSARSDTFTIRTYGEVLNPSLSSTDAGYIAGQAWCEAVVQRLPDYVNPLIAADAQLPTFNPGGNAALTLAKTTNLAFGRKFKIISFRWLSPSDI